MSKRQASNRVMCSGMACMACGIAATVLGLLGIVYWTILVGLALFLLLPMFYYESVCQDRSRSGWNKHKKWQLGGGISLITGVICLVVSVAFWAIRDSANFGSITPEGTGVTPAAVASLALIVFGLIAITAVDDSKLDY